MYINTHTPIIDEQLDLGVLTSLATNVKGKYIGLQLDESDIEYLLNKSLNSHKDIIKDMEREFDQWDDRGSLLLLLLLPLAALSFRKGWLVGFLVVITLQSEESMAFDWVDLWQNKDQQAENALNEGRYEDAINLFKSPSWKGVANYRAGHYEETIKYFSNKDNPYDNYNRGNALAKSGKLNEAILAYQAALTALPELEDARYNMKLVEQAIIEKTAQEKLKYTDPNKKKPSKKQDSKKQQLPQANKMEVGLLKKQNESEKQKLEKAQVSTQKLVSGPKPERHKRKPEDSSTEDQQALEEWLRKIPDDPGGLLRRKFQHEYELSLQKKK